MENILKKCPSCKADVISGQKFCANCGAGQELQMRTKEEIQEMIKRIEEILNLKKVERSEGSIGTMLTIMLLHMASDSCLKWVLGLTNDQSLIDIFKTVTKKQYKEGGD